MYLTPSRWGGTGLLGATVRFDETEKAMNEGVRVLDVFEKSPAAHAGLIPYNDYLLASTDVSLFHFKPRFPPR